MSAGSRDPFRDPSAGHAPESSGVRFEEVSGHGTASELGPNEVAIGELIARARRLSMTEARAIAGALAWQWVALGLSPPGGFAAARATAMVAARRHGRAALEAEAAARSAALESPGGMATAARWSMAENALAGVILGVVVTVVGATSGIVALAIVAAIVAIAAGVVLLVAESGYVTRSRLGTAVGSAALALVVQDVVEPEVSERLLGPWRTVVHD